MPPVKELHYFDRIDSEAFPSNFAAGAEDSVRNHSATGVGVYKKSRGRYQRNASRLLGHLGRGEFGAAMFYYRFLFQERSFDWYAGLFRSAHPVRGEITPSYALLSDRMIGKISTHFPDLRVIYLIRNPVDRAWSAYRYVQTRRGASAVDPTEIESFLGREARSHHWRYVDNTERWRRHLRPGHLLVGFYDAVVMQPETLLAEISHHLGTPSAAAPGVRLNPSLKGDMPAAFRTRAEALFGNELERIAEAFGGYALDWRNGMLLGGARRPATLTL